MQLHFANYTCKIDLGFAMFLLGLYVGIDFHTVYVCLSQMIRTAFDRSMRSNDRHPVRALYRFFCELGTAAAYAVQFQIRNDVSRVS